MNTFSDSLGVALAMVTHFDPKLVGIVELSLRVSLTATLAASCLGLPLGAAIAVGRFPGRQTLTVFLNGDEIPTPAPSGERVRGDSFLLVANAAPERVLVTLPSRRFGVRWHLEVSTVEPDALDGRSFAARTLVQSEPHSLILLRRTS
jgi:hypothetical protein